MVIITFYLLSSPEDGDDIRCDEDDFFFVVLIITFLMMIITFEVTNVILSILTAARSLNNIRRIKEDEYCSYFGFCAL